MPASKMDSESKPPARNFGFYAVRVAALFALFVLPMLLYFFMGSLTQNQRLAWAYYRQPDVLLGDTLPMSGEHLEEARSINKLFGDKQYAKALEALDSSQLPDSDAIAMAKGICCFYLDQNGRVAKELEVLADKPNSPHFADARWLSALAFLQANETAAAKSRLEQIAASANDANAATAAKLLKKME